jgi:hypothetical protein
MKARPGTALTKLLAFDLAFSIHTFWHCLRTWNSFNQEVICLPFLCGFDEDGVYEPGTQEKNDYAAHYDEHYDYHCKTNWLIWDALRLQSYKQTTNKKLHFTIKQIHVCTEAWITL